MKQEPRIQYVDYVSDIPILDKCDFIVSVLTSWQFDVAVAYIHTHNLTNGVLIVESVPFANPVKYRITEEQVSIYEGLFEGIYFCKNRKQPYKIGNLIKFLLSRKTGAPVFLLRPLSNISLRLLSNVCIHNREIHYVALDEGLSSYVPLMDSLKTMYSNTFTVYKKWCFQKLLNATGSFFVKTKEDFGLFDIHRKKLIPNKSACEALEQLYYDRVTPQNDSEYCILIFKDYQVIPDEQAVQIIETILDGVGNSDVDIVIKKHPSDARSSFDETVSSRYPKVRIINSMISGEELVAMYKPCAVVGGYSTVVISSHFIFNVPVVSYSSFYVQNHSVSPMIERHISFFMDQLGDYVTFCSNISDISENLKKISQLNK